MSSLTQDVVARIQEQIVVGEVRPGDKLPAESALMQVFSVSRTVIRDAISRLQAAGLVETYRGKGTFVLTRPSEESFTADPRRIRTVEDTVELLDFRLGSEVEAAGLAALRRTHSQLNRIGQALTSFKAGRDKPSAAVDADYQFHRAIAIAANNRYYLDLLTSLGPTMIAMPQTRLLAEAAEDTPAHFDRVTFGHESIYRAIGRQDGQGGTAAARTHLANSRARLAHQKG